MNKSSNLFYQEIIFPYNPKNMKERLKHSNKQKYYLSVLEGKKENNLQTIFISEFAQKNLEILKYKNELAKKLETYETEKVSLSDTIEIKYKEKVEEIHSLISVKSELWLFEDCILLRDKLKKIENLYEGFKIMTNNEALYQLKNELEN